MSTHRPVANKQGQVDVCSILGICLIVIVAFVIVAALVFPWDDRPRTAALKTNCESNMKQIGSALKIYLSDWHDTYPTNRVVHADGTLGPVSSDVDLTPPAKLVNNRGHNLTWVEALYGYMEPPTDNGNGNIDCGAWECKSASAGCYPKHSKTACMTYAMNRNLVEHPETCVWRSDRTLLVRELDRHVNAELRPINYSCGRPDVPPESPFLTNHDARIGKTNANLHTVGSHMLFADSHVKFYPMSIVDGAVRWDAKERQWVLPPRASAGYGRQQIAITP